jgi:aspartate 1-decarboxylase
MTTRILLFAKIHRATVTHCDLNYEGSCGIGPDLLKASGIMPYERVSVLNVSTGGRLETYVIRGKKKGELSLNGAAARHATVGDKVIILAYSLVPENEMPRHKARIVIVDGKNRVISKRTGSPLD